MAPRSDSIRSSIRMGEQPNKIMNVVFSDNNVDGGSIGSRAVSDDDENGSLHSFMDTCDDGDGARGSSCKTCGKPPPRPNKDDDAPSSLLFDKCSACQKVACAGGTCTAAFFDCEYCDRYLCGTCVTNVPCAGSGPYSCELSNCLECAESGDGDVLYCTHCGRGYCTSCKSMEFCFCLEGDTCPECHDEMHDYDAECYWRHLPGEMQRVVNDFADEGISKERVTEYWKECIQFMPPDNEFDLRLYRKTRKSRAATLILAAYRLLKGKDKEAVYLILFAALLEEVWNRGANYVTKIFDTNGMITTDKDGKMVKEPTAQRLAVYFTSFHSVIENTTTTANIIALLHNQLPSIREKEGRKLFECIDFALGKKVQKSNIPIHTVTVLTPEEHQEIMLGQVYGDSLSMNIITSNCVNEVKQKNFVYKDMTLGWWLKVYMIKSKYHKWASSPVTPSTRYFRVAHEGTTLLLSSAGIKTLQELGIKDGDEIVVEGVESEEESIHGPGAETPEVAITCGVCNVDADTDTLDACNACEKSACENCNAPFFDCNYCDRLLCGECVANVPCEGEGCDYSNCMECTENGDGDVLYCTNCGRGFCTDCRPMEFCFCLVGDTCPECHNEMHDYDVEYYWQYLPSNMQQLVDDFAAAEVSRDKVTDFWKECLRFLPQDKEFDTHQYRKTRQTRAAALILASDHLMKGWDNEAVYLILFAALLEEVWKRGGNYIEKAFEQGSPSAKTMAIYFDLFRSVIEKTTTKSSIIAHLHNQLPNVQEKEGKELFKCMDFALGKLPKSDMPFCSMPALSAGDYEKELRDRRFGDSLNMKIIASSMDNGKKEEGIVYKDMTLGWWLKMYVIRCSYQNWLLNPEIPLTMKSMKYFRVVHKGKTMFLSSAGKKTLHQLGIKDGDEVVVGEVEPEENNTTTQVKAPVKKYANKKKNKKGGGGKKKKKKQPPPQRPSLTEEELMVQYKYEHSRAMTPVFEELGPILKGIRNRLNDMSIKKSAPKVRVVRRKSLNCSIRRSQLDTALPPGDNGLGGKAGKIAYPIAVGEVTNLYKTSKKLAKAPITIDLHGHTRDEALQKLDENVGEWVDTAMRGEYPFVIPVDIICGGGSQILSEVVSNWIRTKRQVANRPKGFV